MQKLIIASRMSELALWQSKYIASLIKEHKNIDVDIVGLKTKGDIILDTPLAKIGGKGLFTKELELSILDKKADLAVHSLKDVPLELPNDLVLCAISKRANPKDVLISFKYKNLNELPKNARVGTTSLRRRMQLNILRSDLDIISLRGNINTRLKKLENNEFDAIILASAGVSRLNIKVPFISEFSLDDMIPAMGQGALGIECINDIKIIDFLKFLNDKSAFIETKIERDFTKTLNGGCQVPIGINAKLDNEKIEVRAVVGLVDGSRYIKEKRVIKKDEFRDFGTILANEFIKKGAKEILDEAMSDA